MKIYDKNVPADGVECLKLVVFPPNKNISSNFKELYRFSDDCEMKLEVSIKSGIVCNSTHNYQIKVVGSFPTSYVNLEVRRGSLRVYSYYVDLKESPTSSDFKRAFLRMKKDLNLR